jgi:hypothetical protein
MEDFRHAIAFGDTRENRELAAALETSARMRPHANLDAGILHRDRDHVVDGTGRRVDLRGVNVGGTFLWEAWIWGGGISLVHSSNQSESHMPTSPPSPRTASTSSASRSITEPCRVLEHAVSRAPGDRRLPQLASDRQLDRAAAMSRSHVPLIETDV